MAPVSNTPFNKEMLDAIAGAIDAHLKECLGDPDVVFGSGEYAINRDSLSTELALVALEAQNDLVRSWSTETIVEKIAQGLKSKHKT